MKNTTLKKYIEINIIYENDTRFLFRLFFYFQYNTYQSKKKFIEMLKVDTSERRNKISPLFRKIEDVPTELSLIVRRVLLNACLFVFDCGKRDDINSKVRSSIFPGHFHPRLVFH